MPNYPPEVNINKIRETYKGAAGPHFATVYIYERPTAEPQRLGIACAVVSAQRLLVISASTHDDR